jgi:HSP20 family molecular chaperone IbpA
MAIETRGGSSMSALTLWARRDPFFAEFDALIRNAFAPIDTPARLAFTPAAEITRDGADAVVKLELPGIDVTKDVTVEVEGGELVVRGERRDERSEESGGRTLREVRYGSFRRSFTLPKHVSADQLSAGYDAGVLSIRVPGAFRTASATRVPVTGAVEQPAVEQPVEQSADEPAQQG